MNSGTSQPFAQPPSAAQNRVKDDRCNGHDPHLVRRSLSPRNAVGQPTSTATNRVGDDTKTQVANRFGGSVVSQYDYRYDALGRRTSVETSGSAFGSTEFTKWGYDERNQVTSSNRYSGSFTATPNLANEVNGERRGYGYDAIGNRETALDQGGSTQITYGANELNQYDAVGSASPTYDDDGNLLDDGTKQLTYNAENQLKSVTVPGVSVSTYDYDFIGRRVRKSVDVLDGSGPDYVVTWVYSGWNKIEERKTVGSTTPVKNFVWGLDLSQSMEGAGGIGGLIATVDGSGSSSVFAYDGNGNVSELFAANGGVVRAHYEYDAFGNVIVATGTLAAANNYRFSTKYADDETGLVYYGYRYFDAGTGRWTQTDPAGEFGGRNLFLFVGNESVGSGDVLGFYSIDLSSAGRKLKDNIDDLLKKVDEALEAPMDEGARAALAELTELLYQVAVRYQLAGQWQVQERFKWKVRQYGELNFAGTFKIKGTGCETKISFGLTGGGRVKIPLAPNPLVPDLVLQGSGSTNGRYVAYWNRGVGSDVGSKFDLLGDLKLSWAIGLRNEKELAIPGTVAKAFIELAGGKTWKWEFNALTLERANDEGWGGYGRLVFEHGSKTDVTRHEAKISFGAESAEF